VLLDRGIALPTSHGRVGRLTIRFTPTIRVTVEGDAALLLGFSGIERRTLSLQRGRVFHCAGGDLLGSSLGGLLKAVRHGPPDALGASRAAHGRALELLFARLALHLAGLVPPELRAVLLRFPPSLRRPLHDLLVTDASGRLRQATESLPGVIGLAAATVLAGKPHTHELLVDGLRRGAKARPLVEEAIRLLGRERQEGFARQWAWPRDPWVHHQAFADGSRRLRAQLQRPALHAAFVLRAPAMTPGWALLRPPPDGLTVDHLPRGREALWCYLSAARLERTVKDDPRISPARLRDAVRFLARNRLLRRFDDALVETLVRELPLSEKCPPARVLQRLKGLDRELKRERVRFFVGEQAARRPLPWLVVIQALEGKPNAAFPPPPLPAARHGKDCLEPLPDTWALAAEARAQQHCVANFAEAALRGRSFLYRGSVGGFRLTLELGPCGPGLELRQLYGKRNKPAPRRVQEAVERWGATGSLAPWPEGVPRPRSPFEARWDDPELDP